MASAIAASSGSTARIVSGVRKPSPIGTPPVSRIARFRSRAQTCSISRKPAACPGSSELCEPLDVRLREAERVVAGPLGLHLLLHALELEAEQRAHDPAQRLALVVEHNQLAGLRVLEHEQQIEDSDRRSPSSFTSSSMILPSKSASGPKASAIICTGPISAIA